MPSQVVKENEVPQGWLSFRLGSVAEFETGKREKGGAKNSGEVLSVGGEHITEQGTIDLSTSPKFISRELYNILRQGKIRLGDSLIVKDGARTGKSVYIRSIPEAGFAVNEHVFIIRPKQRTQEIYNGEFLGFWLRSHSCLKQIERAYHGLIGGINREDISSFLILLPPVPEQKAIASVLRTVQEAKEACERVIAATCQLKQSLLHYLFTYGPVPFDRADQVELRETEYGQIPSDWEYTELKEAVVAIDYGLSEAIPKKPPEGGVKIVSTADLTKDGRVLYDQIRRVEAPSKTVARLTLQAGDILFNWRNSPGLVGKTSIFESRAEPHIFASFILRIRVDENRTHNRYLKNLLNYYRARGVFLLLSRRAVNQANYNRNELFSLKIPLPAYKTQIEIVQQIFIVDAKLAAEEARRDALSNLFQSLLHHLLTGKMRITD